MKPIRYEHTIIVPCTPAQAFAVLDNFDLLPRWQDRCLRMEKLGSGSNAEGTKLRYTYQRGQRKIVMQGTITQRIQSEALSLHYADVSRSIATHFLLRKKQGSTHITQTVELTVHSLAAQVLAPFVQARLRRRTRHAMHKLQDLLINTSRSKDR